MAKHHSNLDLFGLAMGDVEKELLADHPSEVTAENVMEEAMTTVGVIEEAVTITLANPIPDEQ